MDHFTAMLQHSAAGSHRLADPKCRKIRFTQQPPKQRRCSHPASPGLQHPLQGLDVLLLLQSSDHLRLLGHLQQWGTPSQVCHHSAKAVLRKLLSRASSLSSMC